MLHHPGPARRRLQEEMHVETWELCHPENKVFDSTDNCRIRKGHPSGPFSKRLEHRLRQNLRNFNTKTKMTFEKLEDLDGNPNATPTPIVGLEDYLDTLDRDKAQFLADLTGKPGEDENAEPPHCRFEVTIPGSDGKPTRTISWSTTDEYDDAVLVKLLLTLQLKRKAAFDLTVSGPATPVGQPTSEAEVFSEADDDEQDYNPFAQSPHTWNEAPGSKLTIAVSPSTWHKDDEPDQNVELEKQSGPESCDGGQMEPHQLRLHQLRLELCAPNFSQGNVATQFGATPQPPAVQGEGTAARPIPDDLRYACTLKGCGRAFRSKGSLNKHVTLKHRRRSNVPAWDKPRMAPAAAPGKEYACQVEGCSRRFVSRSQLAAHARSHTGEKPFSCRFCGQRFQQKGGLVKHMEVHEKVDDRPYKCGECSSSFDSKKALGIHLKNAHGRRRGELQ